MSKLHVSVVLVVRTLNRTFYSDAVNIRHVVVNAVCTNIILLPAPQEHGSERLLELLVHEPVNQRVHHGVGVANQLNDRDGDPKIVCNRVVQSVYLHCKKWQPAYTEKQNYDDQHLNDFSLQFVNVLWGFLRVPYRFSHP